MADQPQDTSIFKEGQETPVSKEQEVDAANINTPAQPNPLEDLLKEIKNEKGESKYKTVEDALIGLKHAQEYIPQLKGKASETEQEVNELRAKLSRLETLEETVLELTQKRDQKSTDGVALSEEDIAKLVEKTLTTRQKADIQKTNINTVVSSLSEKFGKDAETVFYTKAQELGLTVEEMNALAAKTPKAVLSLLGVSEAVAHKQTNTSPTQGSINSAGFQPTSQSFLGRETTQVTIGATTQDVKNAVDNASKLVEELHKNNLTTYDLTDPKVYQKYFK